MVPNKEFNFTLTFVYLNCLLQIRLRLTLKKKEFILRVYRHMSSVQLNDLYYIIQLLTRLVR